MSRPRPTSPDPLSPRYRESRSNSYFVQTPRYVPIRERDSRTYSPSPPPQRDHQSPRYVIREVETRTYSPSPPPSHSRDVYHPDIFRLEAELERYRAREDSLQFTQQQEIREAQIRKEVEENYKVQLEERKRLREEAKKELEQARLEAEKFAREKLDAERKAEEAVRKREEEQAKRLEQEIRLKVEAEKQAEEAEKRAKAQMEENLELLMKTRMAEKFDDLLETAKERLQIADKPSPSPRSPRKSSTRGKARYETSDIYTIDGEDVDQSGRPGSSKTGGRSYATSSYKPEKDTLPPSEDEWEKVPSAVPLQVPDPPTFEFETEDEDIPHADFSQRPHWPRSYRDASSRSRGRTRHRSHASGTSRYSHRSQDFQSPMSPDLVQQIAHAVADILRGPDYDDVMSQRSGYTEPPRGYSQRRAGRSLDPRAHSDRGEYDNDSRTRSHKRDERERQQHITRARGAISSFDKEFDTTPSASRLQTLPTGVDKTLMAGPETSCLGEGNHSPNENNNAWVGVSEVRISVSGTQELRTDPGEESEYRDGDRMDMTSTGSMTQVNSEISAGGSKLDGRKTPPAVKAYESEKDENVTGGLLKTETAKELYHRTIGRGKGHNYTSNSYGGRARSWPRTDASDVE